MNRKFFILLFFSLTVMAVFGLTVGQKPVLAEHLYTYNWGAPKGGYGWSQDVSTGVSPGCPGDNVQVRIILKTYNDILFPNANLPSISPTIIIDDSNTNSILLPTTGITVNPYTSPCLTTGNIQFAVDAGRGIGDLYNVNNWWYSPYFGLKNTTIVRTIWLTNESTQPLASTPIQRLPNILPLIPTDVTVYNWHNFVPTTFKYHIRGSLLASTITQTYLYLTEGFGTTSYPVFGSWASDSDITQTLNPAPVLIDGYHTWGVRAVDNLNKYLTGGSPQTMGIDRAAPVVSCSTALSGNNINVTLSATDAFSGVRDGDVQVSINGGAWGTSGITDPTTVNSFTYSGTQGNNYSFRFRSLDNSQDISENYTQWSAYTSCGAAITIPLPPANPSGLTVTPSCVAGNVQASFTFTDNSTTEDEFIIDINSAAWTSDTLPSPWGPKTVATVSKAGTGGSVTWVWSTSAGVDSGDTDAITAGSQLFPQQGKTYYPRVIAHNIASNIYSAHIYPPSTTTPSLGASFTTPNCPPADPSGLTILSGCLGSAPQVQMRFRDNANNEDLYYLDINGAAWTGDADPSPWAVKTITSDAMQKTQTGRIVTFIWKNTAATNTSGPMGSGSPLLPANNTTYYWRVLAHSNTDGDSAHIYPPSTPTPSLGASFTTPTCAFDMKAEFVSGTWMAGATSVPNPSTYNFQPGDSISVGVKVTNLNATGADSPPTDLYVYYQLGNADEPICPSLPSPPGHAATTVPGDAAALANQGYSIPNLGPGGTVTKTVTFQIGTATNVVKAYVVPKCELSDSFWPNNVTISQTYTVSTVGFIETQGGDVGTAPVTAPNHSIRMAFDSSTIPKYQSDYLIAAGTIDTKVHSRPSGWMLNNYSAKQVPTNGVYQYYKERFLDQAMLNPTCGNFNKPPISYCNGDFTFNTGGALPKTAPTVDQVIFVDDDLKIESDLILNPDVTLIFIVKEKVIVSLGVTEIDGIFISKEGFADSDVSAASSGVTHDNLLTIKGAVYVDSNGGVLSFKRYFTDAYNNLLPTVKFVFQPKYLAKTAVRDQIGVKSIKWTEVAP